MQLSESTGMFSANNPLAFNQNSDLIDIQGNHQPFNQMGVGYQNIAFIDPTVKDYQNLVNGIVPNTEIVLLDPTRDGVQQITQILANRTAISSAHIISHGEEGSLQLGTAHLDLDNLNQYRTSLEEWKNALTPDADILLYGCNVAAGEKGTSFIQNLSQITDADIAASDNLTGSKALGGDWNLEAKTGTIEAPLAFQKETMAGYNSILLGFAPATNYPAVISLRSVVTADLNGDNKLDLVAASTFNTLSVLLGTGTGTFGTTNYLTVDPETFTVAVADFNGDGKSDIASASRQTNKISIMLGDGTGNFGAITNFNTGNGPSSLAVGDFNADGKADLVTTNNSSNDVSILLGKGDGTFNAATSFGTGTTPFSVVVADLNQDGKSDLATANYGSNNISILLGKGDGSFNPATNLSLVTTPRVITVGDFNSDNKLDLATANLNANNVSVLLGDGTGNFGSPSYFGVATQPLYIANGDLDGDGKLDLVTANNQSGNVSVILGDGKGSFGTASNYSVGSSPQGVTVGDFNKDGLLDIAAANFSSRNVSVLLNSTTLVNFGAATYSGTEGSSDTIVNIPVTLSATPTADVTVPIAINATSTATEGASNDYNLSTTSVVFAAGATGAALTQNIAVTIKPDNISETDETVVLDLGNITGAAAGTTKQTTLTIAANDGINYAVSAGVVSIPEGNSGSNPLTFTVSRGGGIDAASSVDFAIAGTATNNSDYNNIGGTSGATGTTGTINFAAGETQKTITMNVVGDTAFEPDETVIVSLSNPVAPGQTPTISNSSATTTINNDDIAPQPGTLQFSAANFSVPEGNSGGLVNATAVTVNRTGGSSGAVSVQARVNPSNAGTADASDYNSNVFPITVNFADGDTAAKTVIIPINGDTTVEPDETVNLELISGSVTGGATIGSQNTATLTISNDDASTPFTDINAGLPDVGASSVAWGDYDNDGKLDILLTGQTDSNNYISKVYRNTGNGFTDINAGLTGVFDGSAAWGDYDNDGKLDILLTGEGGNGVTISKVYHNTGSGFTDINAGLTGVMASSVAWGDYDNDGKLDILLMGWTNTGSGSISKVYRNTGSGFTDINAGLTGVFDGSAAWGDYDNDGKLDILLTGQTGSGVNISKVYHNTGSGFTDINAGLTAVAGSSAWGDYDNDGKLDILLTGYTDTGNISKVYHNTGSGFTDINAGLTGVSSSSAAWGDYDNDGKLDILLTGQSSSGNIAKVYRNTGSGFTDINAGLTGVIWGSAAWGDYDNDGKLDILLTGQTNTGLGEISKVYRNNVLTANTPPTTPTGLSSTISGTAVTLNWNPATDAQTPTTGLGYNLRVGTTPGGNDVFAPMSLNTGYRQVPRLGNTNMKTSWQLNNLTPGQTYYWSVQGIDSAWAGSPFATEGSFTAVNATPSTVSITTNSYPNANAAEVVNGQPDSGLFTLTRTGNLSTPVTVNYTTGGTATNSTDYNNLPGSITFGANQSTATLPINIINDNLVEGSETATVTITPNNAYTIGSTNNATVFIADTINVPQTINSNLSNTDPDNPTRTGRYRDDYRLNGVTVGQQVQLNLNAPFDAYLQLVNEDTGDVIAFNDDYNGLNSQLTFTVQPGVNYLARVTSYGSGVIGNYSLITSIPTPPTVNISATDANAAEVISGQTPNPGQFTISRTGNIANSLTVNYTTGGTATKGTDYNNIASSITIPAGASSANLPINVIDDNQAEGNEIVSLTLIGNSAYNIGNGNSATVTIADNEPSNNIPIINGNQSINATLSPTDPNNPTRTGSFRDDYRVTGVTSGQQVQLNLNAQFDTYLQLVNADTGAVIASNDDYNGRNSQLTFTAQSGINYLVRVTSYDSGATGDYSLITSSIPTTSPSITVPQTLNSSLTNTDPNNPTRTGSFRDDYRVTGVTSGQQVQLNLNAPFDAYLQLVNADTGAVIASNDDYNGRNSQLTFTAQSGINYLVRVTSYDSGATGDYSLITSSIPTTSPSITVPQTLNSSLTNTDPNNPTRTGSFRDDYRVTGVTSGQQVQLNLNAPFDAYLQLVNADTGAVIASNDDYNGRNSQLTFTAQSGINYLVRVTSYDSGATGDYSLITSSIPTTSPSITVPQTLNSSLTNTDPNNPTRTGSFRDDYRVTGVTSGQQVQLNLNAPFDAYLQLVNADTGAVIASNDDYNGRNSQLTFTAQSGINYLVRVTSYDSGATGDYSLITSSIPTTSPSITVPQTLNSSLTNTDPNNPTRTGSFRDDYRVTGVTSGQQVQLNLNAQFDTYLQLVNADTGAVIASNDDYNGRNSQLTFTAQSGINYLARVTSYSSGATGNYTLLTR